MLKRRVGVITASTLALAVVGGGIVGFVNNPPKITIDTDSGPVSLTVFEGRGLDFDAAQEGDGYRISMQPDINNAYVEFSVKWSNSTDDTQCVSWRGVVDQPVEGLLTVDATNHKGYRVTRFAPAPNTFTLGSPNCNQNDTTVEPGDSITHHFTVSYADKISDSSILITPMMEAK